MTAPTTRRPPPRRYDGPVALASAILTGSADLRGAACTSEPRLYDPDVSAEDLGLTDRGRWQAVKDLCVACPARGACWEWSTGLSNHARPRGPLADVYQDPFAAVRRWERRGPTAAEDPPPPTPDPEPEPAEDPPTPEPEPPTPPPTTSEDPEPEPRRPVRHTVAWVRRCDGRGCSRPMWANGLCQAHSQRYHRDPGQPRDQLLGPLRRSPRDPGDPPPPKRGARSRTKPSIHRARSHRR